jgi:hypothetical protein
MAEKTWGRTRVAGLPAWLWVVIPLVALVALVAVFFLTDPARVFTSAAPPVEELAVRRR